MQPPKEILLAQIEAFRPEMVLNQDVFYVDASLMRRIRQIGKPVIVGQVGVEPSRGMDWSVYDLLLSQLPRIVQAFRADGVRAEVGHLAFEPTADRDVAACASAGCRHLLCRFGVGGSPAAHCAIGSGRATA